VAGLRVGHGAGLSRCLLNTKPVPNNRVGSGENNRPDVTIINRTYDVLNRLIAQDCVGLRLVKRSADQVVSTEQIL
jgi:hypothetical protein